MLCTWRSSLTWRGHSAPAHAARARLTACPPASPLTPPGEEAIIYSDERVEALAQFQATCIRHALRFPALQRLVYSTCRCAGRVSGLGGWVDWC